MKESSVTTVRNFVIQSLQSMIDRHALFLEIGEAMSASSNSISEEKLPQDKHFRMAEMCLLDRFFDASLRKDLRLRGLSGMNALSFILRYHLTWLSAILHLTSLDEVDRQREFELMRQLCPDINWKEYELVAVTNEKISGEQSLILGFSPLGLHAGWRSPQSCRAFDWCDIASCSLPGQPLFCKDHIADCWWRSPSGLGSRQATMFHFYHDLANYHVYSEQDLQRMFIEFSKKLSTWSGLDQSEVSQALQFFGIDSRQSLLAMGKEGLRKAYLQQCSQYHPDMGGNHETFVTLGRHYKCLGKLLFSHGPVKT